MSARGGPPAPPARRRDPLDDRVEHSLDARSGLRRDPEDVVCVDTRRGRRARPLPPRGSPAGRSILFTTGTISRSFSIARYAFASVCAWIPCAASTRRSAPSHAWSERETSYVKSTCPGVSIRLSSCAPPRDPHGLRLDRDPALALELHRVEHLLAHLAVRERLRQLEDAVGKRRLAMVDVRDDREVADAIRVMQLTPPIACRRGRPTIATPRARESPANGQETGSGAGGERRPPRPRRAGHRASARAPRRVRARRRRRRRPPPQLPRRRFAAYDAAIARPSSHRAAGEE